MKEVFQARQVATGRGSETMLAPQEVQRIFDPDPVSLPLRR